MRFHRILTPAALAACAAFAVVATPTMAGAATSPSLPQPLSAQAGATWLAGQFTAQGFIPSQSDPGTADLSATANGLLALVSANTDPSLAATALSFLEANVNAYVSQGGVDGPGQLALLILDVHALGADPTSFGGTNLVARLLATQEPSGKNAGLFGTKAQVNDFNAGDYDQGLALAALAATGNTRGSAIRTAESWLLNQQCPDGGWTSYKSKNNPCDGSPADFEGPDTNSTALAIQGLAAQGDLSGSADTNAHAFLVHAQDSDGGWGFEPNTASTPWVDRPGLDGARPAGHPRPRGFANAEAIRQDREPGVGVGIVSVDVGRRPRVIQLPGRQRTEPPRDLSGGAGGRGSGLPFQPLCDLNVLAIGNPQAAVQGQAHGEWWQRPIHLVGGKWLWDPADRAHLEQHDGCDLG